MAPLLVALAIAAFLPAVEAPFVSDDNLAITSNEYVVLDASPVDIFSNFSWWGNLRADAPGYRPLVTLTFAWTWAVTGADPWAFHITNMALHALVVWLVFLLAMRLGGDSAAAFWTAALFAVLPIHSEAVIWSVGRAELLAAASWAATFVALIDYRRKGRVGSLALAGTALMAGLLCKENAITILAAPVILALVMPLPQRTRTRDWVGLGVLVGVTLAYFVLRAAAGSILPAKPPDSLDNPLSGLSAMARIAGAFAVFGRYLWLSIWPHPLSVDYSYDALGISEGFVGDRYAIIGLAAAIGLAVVAMRERNTRPVVTVALCMAAAAYSIVSNSVVLIGTVMGERLFYLPTLALCLALTPALTAAAQSFSGRGTWALAAAGVVLLLVDWQRALVWNDPVTLFQSAAAAHPRSARAQMELGSAYGAAGRTEEAIESFHASVAVRPTYGAAWYNLGNLYARTGRNDKAIEIYDVALEHAPKLVPAWFNLGMVYRVKGDLARAQGAFAHAAELAPRDGETQLAYGDTLLSLGRNTDAIDAYTSALAAGVSPATAQVNRGVARERLGGCEEGLRDYLAVAEMLPTHSTAVRNSVNCLRLLGRGEEAERLLARARVANRNTGR
jgi:tetratricopeptide (TPR) repeat protein